LGKTAEAAGHVDDAGEGGFLEERESRVDQNGGPEDVRGVRRSEHLAGLEVRLGPVEGQCCIVLPELS
jgi:hypothetical protein